MAVRIGSLLIRIAVEHGILQEGLSKAERDVANSTKRIAGEFATGSTKIQRDVGGALNEINRRLASFGEHWVAAGKKLTIGVTTPIAGVGAAVVKMTADFESSMNRVGISTNGSAAELQAMSDLALKLGKDTTFGATEAAEAMDMLAKNGLAAKEILGGAATAAVNLASAAGSDLAPAADAITDVMQQFKLSAGELPGVVNQVTGAVNQSKLNFEDFALAIGQAGGVAGASGVEFEDFNAVLAGTSSLFASGSDAGTSFKTFLTALPGKSSSAAGAIETLGLKFYDAQGNLRSMSEIAQELQEKLSGLSEVARNQALTQIFGTDAMRTAVGLMDLGAAGLDKIKTKIAETDAAAQAAKRLEGFNGQMENLSGAVETLAIRIGQSGLLDAMTALVTRAADLVDWLSETSPWVLRLATAAAVAAAALGPMMLVTGALAATILPLFAARFGPIGLAISAFVNPLGTAISLLTQFAIRVGGLAILQTIGGVVLRFLGPIGLLVTAATLIYQNWDRISAVFQEFWAAAQQTLGPPLAQLATTISDIFAELWSGPLGEGIRQGIAAIQSFGAGASDVFGTVVVAVLKAFLDVVIVVLEQVANVIRGINALLSGDFAGAWQAASAIVVRALGPFGALAVGAIGAMAKLAAGVREWLQDKLGAVFDWVGKKIEQVTGFFFEMYDAVVGNSYVPDMVEGIRVEMAKLTAFMVVPAQKAAQGVEDTMRNLAGRVRAVLAELYPEIEAANAKAAKIATLFEGERAGQLSTAARRDAVRRAQGFDDGPLAEVAKVNGAAEQIKQSMARLAEDNKVQTVRIAETYKDMVDSILGSLRQLADGIKGGDFFSILEGLAGIATTLGGAGVFGKGFQSRLQGIPGNANGTAYHPGGLMKVGERGPEILQVPRGGRVVPNHELRAAGGGALKIVLEERTDLVAARIDGRIAEAAPGIAGAGAELAMSKLRRARERALA